ncbi:hypothetical protein L2E82_20835 [Cichorium intybus]|uniref:Uncharacterized protein n=1 Tax=Cichorium intybus TaxID=13427 RepID=A0ACB9DVF8_CICIN|nr:hypothetical protein L2E82_20835 [Cichorium intybus]
MKKRQQRFNYSLLLFLLYSGGKEAAPPNLRSQIDGSFTPRNNIEEGILLLMILLRKINLKKIEWDPSVFNHLCYALSISGGLGALGKQLEELIPVGKQLEELIPVVISGGVI